ncbi:FeoB-associated Cys-rich membrane protein [Senegalia massiliensis]|uniref:FeoB-associated Cys-rich membrane protein n=1 Tax=Senegalia massiliensis TaxID=1720316 RepID=A0A845QRU9_9CLOT|nr:FeoB-associated Cys-rich membrane protein [Senegalia massiliensis]NBI05265.1 FeoB-associated Cys-rich membrane protein [Senegalia massiliensis]
MVNIIVGLIIFVIIGLSIGKVVKEKKRGTKCIGCPHGGANSNKNNCNCS